MPHLAERVAGHLHIKLIHTQVNDPLKVNESCGAEYVVKEKKMPS